MFRKINQLTRKKKIVITASLLLVFTASTATAFSLMSKKSLDTRSDAASAPASLTVNASVTKNPFSAGMRGLAYVNWEHSWNKPLVADVPQLTMATKVLKPGVIRYAGGLWANYVGWDRTNQRTPYTEWKYPGDSSTYAFHYGKDEIDNLAVYAKNIAANVMIQVNVANNNPAMWADMVKYTNKEKGYNFKYWELGNEFDIDSKLGITHEMYAQRAKAYAAALHAVDPTIIVVGGVPGGAMEGYDDSNTQLSGYLTQPAASVDSLSYHWYQQCNSSSLDDMMIYEWDGLPTTSWRNNYSRKWADIIPNRLNNEVLKGTNKPIGITELNFDACNYENGANNNQFGAVRLADVLGRLAYNGLDYSTLYEGYGEQGYAAMQKKTYTRTIKNQYGKDEVITVNYMTLNPTYYTLLMYSQYFGDQMVESSSTDNQQMSIWASKDSKDPGKLKLMITNLTGSTFNTPIAINNFTAKSGKAYQLTGNISGTDINQRNTAKINGVSLNAADIKSSPYHQISNGQYYADNSFSATDLQTATNAIQPANVTVSANTFTYNFPAYSVTSIILDGSAAAPTPSTAPTATLTPTAKPTVISTPTPVTSRTPTPSPKPSATPTPMPSKIPTLTPTKIPTVTPTPTVSVVPTRPVTPTPTKTPENTNGGLTASYFKNRNLSGTPVLTRKDATINFDWRTRSPGSKVPSNNFSVRWEGYLSAPKSGRYTLTALADDGIKVWINDKLIINDWGDHSARETSKRISLQSGVKYKIKVEYYEHNGNATAKLLWSSKDINKRVIESKYFSTTK